MIGSVGTTTAEYYVLSMLVCVYIGCRGYAQLTISLAVLFLQKRNFEPIFLVDYVSYHIIPLYKLPHGYAIIVLSSSSGMKFL